MKNNRKSKIELLAPVGNFKMLAAAINAGCDSIYFGLKEFNMRQSAQNFNLNDLVKIKKICQENTNKETKKEIKRYLTINTIIYNKELKKIEKIIKKVKPYINAVICWDLSIINLARKHKIPFHISTQASVANIEAAKFYKKLGAKRIILARELNLKQIKQISKIIPVEIFAHGALCVSQSGRCFTSQFLFNKSANRGECVHPCRRYWHVKDNEGNELKVQNNYIFSAKDLCSLPFIEKIKKSNISAIKIEGRNRDVEYVDTIIRIYRKALDKKLNKKEIKQSIEELKKVYNKGFSSGFLLKLPTSDDFSNAENSKAKETKVYVGKVFHYFTKQGVSAVKVSKTIKLGDKIFIIGNKTGLIRSKVKSMQVNHKPVEKVEKGDEVGIKLPLCRRGDEIYKVVKVR